MYDPPSQDLMETLTQVTACQERDVRACRRAVRQLSKDLPTFDSLWLDALVQSRRLTAYQADELADGRGNKLLIGDYQLLERTKLDRFHNRYLARQRNTRKVFLIDEHIVPGGIDSEVTNQLETKRHRSGSLISAGMSLHQETLMQDSSLFVVHDYFPGLSAQELLIRQGRLSGSIIRHLTGQLLHQLKVFQQHQVVHGDLRISNLIFDRRGYPQLLNCGIRTTLYPQWTTQTPLPFECYDFFAPEIVSTGTVGFEGDLYAAGCLLWQLACGRPTTYSSDKLVKIKSHLTRRIPDVREFSPEIDSQTAQTILQLTDPDPQKRNPFQSNSHSRKSASRSRPVHQELQRYVSRFERPLPQSLQNRTAKSVTKIAASLAAVMLMMGIWQGISLATSSDVFSQIDRKWLLNLGNSTATESHAISQQESLSPQAGIPLPPVSPEGVLVLEAGKLYQTRDLPLVGPLVVKTAPSNDTEPAAIIQISEQPWRIAASEISLANVRFRRSSQAKSTAALLICQSATLKLDRCRFEQDNDLPTAASARSIAWKPLPAKNGKTGNLSLNNSQFLVPGSGVMVGGGTQQIRLSNCLKSGSGSLIEFNENATRKELPQVICEQLTLRQADGLVRLNLGNEQRQQPAPLRLEVTNSVCDIRSGHGLVSVAGASSPDGQIGTIDLLGHFLLVQPGTDLLTWVDAESNQQIPLTINGTVEGVMPFPITFQGNNATILSSSELKNYQGPRWNSVAPGIQSAQFDTGEAALR